MMNTIEAATQDLIQCILNSEEYLHFCRLREQVRKAPELRKRINEYRRQVYQVQNEHEPADMYGEQEWLCRLSAEFRKDELVNEFLKAELHVCRCIQQAAFQIADAIDLDLDQVMDPEAQA